MNKFEKVVEIVGKDTLKVVEYPFVHTAQFVTILGEALVDEPKVRTAVIDIVKAGEKIVADAGADALAKGLDLSSDLETVADVQAFFKLFASEFLPTVEAAYKDLAADAK